MANTRPVSPGDMVAKLGLDFPHAKACLECPNGQIDFHPKSGSEGAPESLQNFAPQGTLTGEWLHKGLTGAAKNSLAGKTDH